MAVGTILIGVGSIKLMRFVMDENTAEIFNHERTNLGFSENICDLKSSQKISITSDSSDETKNGEDPTHCSQSILSSRPSESEEMVEKIRKIIQYWNNTQGPVSTGKCMIAIRDIVQNNADESIISKLEKDMVSHKLNRKID